MPNPNTFPITVNDKNPRNVLIAWLSSIIYIAAATKAHDC